MLSRLRVSVICLSAAGLALWLGGFVLFAVGIEKSAAPRYGRTDAIIVLTGGPDRVNTGLDLLDARRADGLFISGVNEQVTIQELVVLWRPDAVPPCCITLGHRARNTFENALETRDWIRENSIRSIWLLTADYHMPRALLEFSAALPNTDIHPYPVASPSLKNDPPRYLLLEAAEYHKTILTWLRIKTGVSAG